MPTAEKMKTMWMIVCHMTPGSVSLAVAVPRFPASMKVFSRWIDEMPMIAMASLILSTLALTWSSHSGWSGWPSSLSRDTNVS
jgi:hypothetical protein